LTSAEVRSALAEANKIGGVWKVTGLDSVLDFSEHVVQLSVVMRRNEKWVSLANPLIVKFVEEAELKVCTDE
jgi:hypothetical protein